MGTQDSAMDIISRADSISELLPMLHLRGEAEVYNADEVATGRFLPVSDREYSFFHECVMYIPECIHVFPYIRKDSEGCSYADIYFAGRDEEDGEVVERFILVPGKRLPHGDEVAFIRLCRNVSLMAWEENMASFYESVALEFPEYHLMPRSIRTPGRALENFYFVSHRGLLEILYKAGLGCTAYYTACFDGIDFLGTNPAGIIGVPLKVLRILDNNLLVDRIFLAKDKERSLNLFRRFGNLISEEGHISRTQWDYLEMVCDGKIDFSKEVYYAIEFKESGYLEKYMEFVELRSKYGKYVFSKDDVFEEDTLDNCVYELKSMEKLLEREEYYNNALSGAAAGENLDFYGDDRYFAFVPRTLREFLLEAVDQHNCLKTYLESVVERRTMIVFIREKSAPEKSLVTVEITGRWITQAYGTFNRYLTPEELDFLDRYCLSRFIEYDPFDIDIVPQEEWGDKIIEYDQVFNAYLERRNKGLEDMERESGFSEYTFAFPEIAGQLSLSDIYDIPYPGIRPDPEPLDFFV